jgi:hypothetical protein
MDGGGTEGWVNEFLNINRCFKQFCVLFSRTLEFLAILLGNSASLAKSRCLFALPVLKQ